MDEWMDATCTTIRFAVGEEIMRTLLWELTVTAVYKMVQKEMKWKEGALEEYFQIPGYYYVLCTP